LLHAAGRPKIGPFHPEAQCLLFLLLWEFGC
jgi:hypothetical protein